MIFIAAARRTILADYIVENLWFPLKAYYVKCDFVVVAVVCAERSKEEKKGRKRAIARAVERDGERAGERGRTRAKESNSK